MLNDLQGAPEPVAKLPPSLSAPRVSVRQMEGGQAVEPAPDTEPSGVGFREAFLNAFGTADEIVAQALCEQLLNALNTASARPIDDATANLTLALVHALAPKDAVEAMLACQMITTHVAAMDASRRALHADQRPGGRQAYMSISRRLMTLYAAQVDTLNRHCGKGTTQKIVIERVVVAPGAQAVVGAVSSRGKGDGP
jgi:hypothetical protein